MRYLRRFSRVSDHTVISNHRVSKARVRGAPNKALQPTAAAVLVCHGQKLRLAAAAAELGR
jgi:hypothetical protein